MFKPVVVYGSVVMMFEINHCYSYAVSVKLKIRPYEYVAGLFFVLSKCENEMAALGANLSNKLGRTKFFEGYIFTLD